MTLAGVRFSEAMDVKLVRLLRRRDILPKGGTAWTCAEVVQFLLPDDAWAVLAMGDACFLEHIKFNRVPFTINPVNALLRHGMTFRYWKAPRFGRLFAFISPSFEDTQREGFASTL